MSEKNEQTLIEEARDVFLDGVDQDTYKENLEILTGWEQELSNNEAMASWQEHDVTKRVSKTLKAEYVTASMRLANGRNLSELERNTCFAKQDACLFLLALMGGDVKTQIAELRKQIRSKISEVKG